MKLLLTVKISNAIINIIYVFCYEASFAYFKCYISIIYACCERLTFDCKTVNVWSVWHRVVLNDWSTLVNRKRLIFGHCGHERNKLFKQYICCKIKALSFEAESLSLSLSLSL